MQERIPFAFRQLDGRRERPAIERGKSKIVVSYKTSELTSNAILTWLRTSRPSTTKQHGVVHSNNGRRGQFAKSEAVNQKPKAIMEHIGHNVPAAPRDLGPQPAPGARSASCRAGS